MEINLAKFSHIPSELPKDNKSKVKIYIAYKSDISSFLAYIIYKRLSNCNRFELFYDKACIALGVDWERALDVHMNQCDIVLIIGQEGAFDSFKLKKYKDDFFIKELESGLNKKKAFLYIPVENYLFWKDEILAKKRLCVKCGNKINERQIKSLLLQDPKKGGGLKIFEDRLYELEQEVINIYENCLPMYSAQQTDEDLNKLSTMEQRKEINSIQQL